MELPMQSVPITTKLVSMNPAHGEMYSIQHYVIKFVSDLWQIGGFNRECFLVGNNFHLICSYVVNLRLKR
jgi:hypothetical protein